MLTDRPRIQIQTVVCSRCEGKCRVPAKWEFVRGLAVVVAFKPCPSCLARGVVRENVPAPSCAA